MVLSGSTLYIGGGFTLVSGISRRSVAAVNATDGSLLGWHPYADGFVSALALGSGVVYAGGDFTTIGGLARNRIAALDPISGNATAWDPGADRTVNAFAVSGGTIYAGGLFREIGGQTRFSIAALDASTGTALPWDPSSGGVFALALGDTKIYLGGWFVEAGHEPQIGIAAIDIDSPVPALATLISADAEPNRVVLRWLVSPEAHVSQVYRKDPTEDWHPVGPATLFGSGHVEYEDNQVLPGEDYEYALAQWSDGAISLAGHVQVTTPLGTSFAFAGAQTNPTDRLVVSFTLPDDRPAEIEVFDVSGRRVLNRRLDGLGRGSHIVRLDDERALSSGIYLLKLSHGGRSLAARATIIH